MIQTLLFAIVAIIGFGYGAYQFARLRRRVLLGREEPMASAPAERLRNMTLIAFGQKKMFKRWIPAVFHLFIYVAFIFTQIELVEIFVDGFTGSHRSFVGALGPLYTVILNTIEVLSVLALVATVVFLVRRNALYIPRFHKPELAGWPHKDANIILYLEIVLVLAIVTMNGTDAVLQGRDPAHYADTGFLAVSSWLGPLLFGGLSTGTLMVLERAGWWLHFLVVISFLNYLPISKHLHIIFAFPSVYWARLRNQGEMTNMPDVQREVASIMNPDAEYADDGSEDVPEFGANDVMDLGWVDVLGAYACTQCGRCTAMCPANITGKKLSPRKIMMDIRSRAEEVGAKIDSGDAQFISAETAPAEGETAVLTKDNFDDGRSLFDYISREELHACTTCQACIEACPININPLEPILRMRRYEILTEAAGPGDWLPMFTAIENGGSAWAIADPRDKWAQEVEGV